MNQTEKKTTPVSCYAEVKMGRTTYRVTSVFLGEKDLGKALEQLAVRKAMIDIKSGAG